MATIRRLKKWVPVDPAIGDHQTEGDVGLCAPAGIAAILAARGIRDAEEIERFFHPRLTDLPEPGLMKGMREAVAILLQAVLQKRPVVIYGDYDVDGVTGVAVISLFLKEIGANCRVCLPHRQRHGYGLNADLIVELAEKTKAAAQGAVLLTVDCGISNCREVKIAKERGFNIIVTDHHQLPATLPEADAILNPLQQDCSFPFKGLAGVGVAFYLMAGLRAAMRQKGLFSERNEPNLKNVLDLVAIGTICDMVPLLGVNRILVKSGMEVLQGTNRIGLQALRSVAGLSEGSGINEEDIGYRIGPRINAAGRLDDAAIAYRLLVADDAEEAIGLARQLDAINETRKDLTDEVYQSCCSNAEELHRQGRISLVMAGQDWHLGVLGIVASRLVQKFYLPTILLSTTINEKGEGILKGSARSINGFNIFEALQSCEGSLEKYGGHAQAAGVTIKSENFDLFSESFEDVARKSIKESDLRETVEIFDATLLWNESGQRFFEYFKKIAPFGVGNPEPVFAALSCSIGDLRIVGEKHLSFNLYKKERKFLAGIAFNRGELLSHLQGVKQVDIAFTLRANQYRGRETWQACFVDAGDEITT